MSEFFRPENEMQLRFLIERVKQGWIQGKPITLEVVTGDRTSAQNSSLHLYLTILANQLNAAGLDMRAVMKPGAEIPWTMQSCKDYLWRPIQKAMFGESSTTKPNKKQYPEIYEALNRHLVNKFGRGAYVAWPCKEDLGRAEYPEAEKV